MGLLVALAGRAIPVLERALAYRLFRAIALWLLGALFERLLLVLLRHGQVRHLEDVEQAIRTHIRPELADEFRDMVGDKETFVLQRDSDSWRERS